MSLQVIAATRDGIRGVRMTHVIVGRHAQLLNFGKSGHGRRCVQKVQEVNINYWNQANRGGVA